MFQATEYLQTMRRISKFHDECIQCICEQHGLTKMEDTMSQSTVSSKINGIVKSINENESTDEHGNQQPFMSILTVGDYRVKGTVNETNVYSLSEGQSVILRSRVDETKTWTGTIEKIDTENKQANNNNMLYDGSNSDNQSSKYPFYVKLDSADGLMLGQHLYVELDEGQTDAKDGIWLYSGYIVQDESRNRRSTSSPGNSFIA